MITFIRPAFVLVLFTSLFLVSCKKEKSDKPAQSDGTTEIKTIELTYTNPSQPVYGLDFTFKLQFDKLKKEDVVEYGVAYSPWITRSGDKTCLITSPTTFKLKFGTSPQSAGVVESLTKTMEYKDFNDANYRAYAILANGTVIYGAIKYIVFA